MSSVRRAAALSCPSRLLDKIDELRKLGLQDRVSLPQIAVMGDQSSGKSSLLEYISGVTFPKDCNFCTCFATEVSMRHSPEFSARLLINHQPDDRLKQPGSIGEVGEVIERAKEIFVQEHGGKERAGYAVFDEVLTVELSGPGLPMLTLVDLPGYIHTHTSRQPATIVKDIENLIQKYLESPRTIILAVIPVNQDFSQNVVIRHVREVDGEGKRTLGVLTKPDMVDRGTENKVLEILSGREMPLERGYHIIKNKNFEESQAAEPLEETSAKEDRFFSRFPWSTISPNDKGILSLVEKLTETLSKQVEKEFPSIKREIFEEKEKLEKQLQSLGPAFETDTEKAHALQRNVNHVMNQLKSLIDGHYSRVAFPPKYFIRAQIQKLNHKFHERIASITAARAKSLNISNMMELTRGRELQGMIQFEPFVILCRKVIDGWLCVTTEHIAQVCKLFRSVSADVIEKECDKLLVDYFCERMSEYLALQEKRMLLEAREIHDDELTPMTCQGLDNKQSWSGLTAHSGARSGCYSPLVVCQSSPPINDDNCASIQWSAESPREESSDFTVKTREAESSEHSQTRGLLVEYCRIAVKRYVDAICMYVIERRLFKKCDEKVLEWFLEDKTALSWIRESAHTSRMREILPAKITDYKEALAKL